MAATPPERDSLTQDFRLAQSRGELSVVYQPVVELASGALIGFESLMRWRHASQGAISPATFVPLAETSGMLGEAGLWALKTALNDLAGWRRLNRAATEHLFVAVNVSPAQLGQGSFDRHCRAVLGSLGLPTSALHLELTETMAMTTDEGATEMERLHKSGFHILIDDFGTGFSSLSYLHRLPFRTLKLDKSFVHDLPDGREARIIVSAIVRMAHDLGKAVTAEGIETEAQRDFLRELSCDAGQGYLFGRPMPADEIEAMFAGA